MPDPKLVRMPFRLALRREGRSYNAYFAKSETMDDAILVGSLSMRLAEDDETRRAWQAFMEHAFARFIEDVVGVQPTMTRETAPEHERGGHG